MFVVFNVQETRGHSSSYGGDAYGRDFASAPPRSHQEDGLYSEVRPAAQDMGAYSEVGGFGGESNYAELPAVPWLEDYQELDSPVGASPYVEVTGQTADSGDSYMSVTGHPVAGTSNVTTTA